MVFYTLLVTTFIQLSFMGYCCLLLQHQTISTVSCSSFFSYLFVRLTNLFAPSPIPIQASRPPSSTPSPSPSLHGFHFLSRAPSLDAIFGTMPSEEFTTTTKTRDPDSLVCDRARRIKLRSLQQPLENVFWLR